MNMTNGIPEKVITFYPQNDENECKHNFWSYVYFHGVLENYAKEADAGKPDLVEADIKLKDLSDGIYAGNFHYSADRVEKCLAFVYTRKNTRGGLVVHIADLRSIEYAFECFTEKREVI